MERNKKNDKKNVNGPVIDIGIFTADKIMVEFKGGYRSNDDGRGYSGLVEFTAEEIEGEIKIVPSDKQNSSFIIKGVLIGKGFHWERPEDQEFRGIFKIVPETGQITAVNCIHLEDYLKSVISSEMNAGAHPESLKAHAVISRSWLMSQLKSKAKPELTSIPVCTDTEIIKWFDREAHDNYDVCADDHCQRYQGITKVYMSQAVEAVEATRGVVLTYGGEVCDARYSKCCGGISENYENVWENNPRQYLRAVSDSPTPEHPHPDTEEKLKEWIDSSPDVFCNVADKEILSRILNDYDTETDDFFRWKVEYGQYELSELLKNRTGVDFGTVTGIIPVERGDSGRIIRLEIIGSERTMTIGKELFIRQALSESHLYSSAFYVDKTETPDGMRFILHGAGWGHGVGLCQIGAAAMAEKGYGYKKILEHYYPDAIVENIY
ncbi:MAG: SpoIID/LytB domain-containing protein [Rikenellaceae bacterium]|nr:SpoIID/LytB domain-containing protein [Rikenellaceae bacterium]